MKIIRSLLTALLALVAATVFADKPLAGPKGGRILTTDAPHAEFFVAQDRSVVVTFYDAKLQPVAPAGQVVTATVEAKPGKVALTFAEKNGRLVSNAKLPEGDDYNVVVHVRENSAARPRNYRVRFHEEVCGECQRAEYACTCEDAGAHDHDHQ